MTSFVLFNRVAKIHNKKEIRKENKKIILSTAKKGVVLLSKMVLKLKNTGLFW